jgi:uncharacterized protein YndB with AHSA1/START domain
MNIERVHCLKTRPAFFGRFWTGRKTAELRRDDRDFRIGDDVLLEEWDPENEEYTGRALRCQITDIVRDAERFGLMKGFAMLSLQPYIRHNTE